MPQKHEICNVNVKNITPVCIPECETLTCSPIGLIQDNFIDTRFPPEWNKEEKVYENDQFSDYFDAHRNDSFSPCVHAGANTVCGKWTVIDGLTGERGQFFCESGRCARLECRQMWVWKRQQMIRQIACNKSYFLNRFVTLTFLRDLTKDETWTLCPKIWDRMRWKLIFRAKEWGIPLRFVAVLERHKDGYPHIHLITNMYMDEEEWMWFWTDSGGGWKIDIQNVKNADELVDYIAKYITKNSVLGALEEMPKRARTLWRSQCCKSRYEIAILYPSWDDGTDVYQTYKLDKTKIRWESGLTKMLDVSNIPEIDECEVWPEHLDLEGIVGHDAVRHNRWSVPNDAVCHGVDQETGETLFFDRSGNLCYNDKVRNKYRFKNRKVNKYAST